MRCVRDIECMNLMRLDLVEALVDAVVTTQAGVRPRREETMARTRENATAAAESTWDVRM